MARERSLLGFAGATLPVFRGVRQRTTASYEHELAERRRTEVRLRRALAREEALLHQKDELLNHREILSREADHRLMNGLQMVVSLLSLQSRGETDARAAAYLSSAANRVATIARIHSRLHSLDGAGLGMKIVLTLVEQIGGKLQIYRCGQCQGTRFAVAFA